MDSKDEQINSKIINQKKLDSEDTQNDKKSIEIENDIYKFGWSNYSEKTNGRFAMLGFLAIILIELLSQKSFLEWAGIL